MLNETNECHECFPIEIVLSQNAAVRSRCLAEFSSRQTNANDVRNIIVSPMKRSTHPALRSVAEFVRSYFPKSVILNYPAQLILAEQLFPRSHRPVKAWSDSLLRRLDRNETSALDSVSLRHPLVVFDELIDTLVQNPHRIHKYNCVCIDELNLLPDIVADWLCILQSVGIHVCVSLDPLSERTSKLLKLLGRVPHNVTNVPGQGNSIKLESEINIENVAMLASAETFRKNDLISPIVSARSDAFLDEIELLLPCLTERYPEYESIFRCREFEIAHAVQQLLQSPSAVNVCFVFAAFGLKRPNRTQIQNTLSAVLFPPDLANHSPVTEVLHLVYAFSTGEPVERVNIESPLCERRLSLLQSVINIDKCLSIERSGPPCVVTNIENLGDFVPPSNVFLISRELGDVEYVPYHGHVTHAVSIGGNFSGSVR